MIAAQPWPSVPRHWQARIALHGAGGADVIPFKIQA